MRRSVDRVFNATLLVPVLLAPVACQAAVGGDTAIYAIQGPGHESPLVGRTVSTRGVVTAVARDGFYLQDPAGDGDDATSDGIFVRTGSQPELTAGAHARVTGEVQEDTPGGERSGNLSVTRLAPASIEVLPGPPVMISPTVLGAGGRLLPESVIDDDGNSAYQPDEDGLDFWESLEGMWVRIPDARVVAGTKQSYGEVAVVVDDGADASLLSGRGALTIRPDDFNPEVIIVGSLDRGSWSPPDADVGDRLGTITGAVGYSFGKYIVFATEATERKPGGLSPETTSLAGSATSLTVASFNVENLGLLADTDGDGQPDATDQRIAAVARAIIDNLGAPDIIGLQEMGDDNGAPEDGSKVINDGVFSGDRTFEELVRQLDAIGGDARYAFCQIDPQGFHTDGGFPEMNIRVGYLFRTDRGVALAAGEPGASRSRAEVKPGPGLTRNPVRVDPRADCFQGGRKPLAAHFTWQGQDLFLVNLHLKSKRGDDPLFGRTQPPVQHTQKDRVRQADRVHRFVAALLKEDPSARVAVLGDFNDFHFSPTIERTLCGDLLTNLHSLLPEEERYTYIFNGNAQVLDHILVSRSLLADAEVDVVHLNCEFDQNDPRRVSDHDPIVARLVVGGAP